MSDRTSRTFSPNFRQIFLRGLAVLLPTVLTLWIVVQGYRFVDGNIAQPVNSGIRLGIANLARVWEPLRQEFDPPEEAILEARIERNIEPGTPQAKALRGELRAARVKAWWDSHWYMDFIGLVVAFLAVYIAGRLLGSFLGRRAYRKIETVITSVPVFKQVYPYVKQIVDFLFADDRPINFNRVVVVEYPRPGIWSIGLVTGDSMKAITAESGDAITVFIPSSPTPFTGYTITVPVEDAIEIPISIDEALRFTISGGVLVPPHQAIESKEKDPSSSIAEAARPTGLIPLTPEVASTPSSGDNGGEPAEPGQSEPRRNAG